MQLSGDYSLTMSPKFTLASQQAMYRNIQTDDVQDPVPSGPTYAWWIVYPGLFGRTVPPKFTIASQRIQYSNIQTDDPQDQIPAGPSYAFWTTYPVLVNLTVLPKSTLAAKQALYRNFQPSDVQDPVPSGPTYAWWTSYPGIFHAALQYQKAGGYTIHQAYESVGVSTATSAVFPMVVGQVLEIYGVQLLSNDTYQPDGPPYVPGSIAASPATLIWRSSSESVVNFIKLTSNFDRIKIQAVSVGNASITVTDGVNTGVFNISVTASPINSVAALNILH